MRIKARYRRLALQIAALEMERQAECRHVSDLLEAYVDAELSDEDARALYPRVWDHLQECARCREDYEAMITDPDVPSGYAISQETFEHLERTEDALEGLKASARRDRGGGEVTTDPRD